PAGTDDAGPEQRRRRHRERPPGLSRPGRGCASIAYNSRVIHSGNIEELRGRRVVVGLSGGVDSAVAALLLRDAGADVHALHMTNWEDDDGYCTAAGDLQDARAVCAALDIPLHHVNFAREYRDEVFAHFLGEYR